MKMTFQEIRIIATGPCTANQLRDVNTICRRSWYIAAHVWKIYDFKIEVKRGWICCPKVRVMQIVLCELRNNSTVFEELEVSIVDLTVSNAVLLETRSGARKMDICDRQIHNWNRQLFKYSTVIPILMKFAQHAHTSLKTYK
jgi:hypothetical protein